MVQNNQYFKKCPTFVVDIRNDMLYINVVPKLWNKKKGEIMEKLTVDQIRRMLGYTQSQMAEHLGICQNAYINKANGESKFSAQEATKICVLSGRRFEDIIFF